QRDSRIFTLHRRASFEDADLAVGRGLPTVDVVPDVTEELGTEIHVIFGIDAPPVATEDVEAAAGDERADILPPFGEGRATFTASVDPRSKSEPPPPHSSRTRPGQLPLLRPGLGRNRGYPPPRPGHRIETLERSEARQPAFAIIWASRVESSRPPGP